VVTPQALGLEHNATVVGPVPAAPAGPASPLQPARAKKAPDKITAAIQEKRFMVIPFLE
jgi:hypothetical protein